MTKVTGGAEPHEVLSGKCPPAVETMFGRWECLPTSSTPLAQPQGLARDSGIRYATSLATLLVRNVRVPESTNVIACTWFYIFLITPTPICPSAFLCPSWENKMVFLKGKFFPGGQEKERGTFLSPTSRSSRRSAHNGGTSPLDFSSKVNFAPPVPGAPFSRPLGLHYFGFSVLLVLLVFHSMLVIGLDLFCYST